MLPKENRLRKKKDFDRIFSQGKVLNTPFFSVRSIENHLDILRFGFIISKKVSPKAVVRNRIKRIMRETVRMKIQNKKGLDIVFLAKPDILKYSAFEIREEINKILNYL